jgi:molybdopterin-containing oxidoreductase family iron-sulfur binding subunit
MPRSRRRFFRDAGAATLGLGCGLPLLETGCSMYGDSSSAEGSSHQWAMVVDMEKCRDEAVRNACTEACRKAHNIPVIPDRDDAIAWIWDEPYEHVFEDQVHERNPHELLEMPVLVLCNHCEKPPCVRVCPTQATWKRDTDGVVMMDMHRCIGCRYCMAACPYGSRSFNWRDPRDYIEKDADGEYLTEFPTRRRGVVEKCNFCVERIREGLRPACVEAAEAVPGGEGALVFGDLGDPDSEVNRILEEERTIVRRHSLGTGPNIYYIV